MCQERCISAIPFIRDPLHNVNQMAWLQKFEIYGKLLGAPRTEKVIGLEQTKLINSFSDGTRQEHPTKFFYQNLEFKAKKNEKIARK